MIVGNPTRAERFLAARARRRERRAALREERVLFGGTPLDASAVIRRGARHDVAFHVATLAAFAIVAALAAFAVVAAPCDMPPGGWTP